jgi:hypothetical protein
VSGCGAVCTVGSVVYVCGEAAEQDPGDPRPPGMRVCQACYERLMAPLSPAERMRTHIAHASNCSQPATCRCAELGGGK